MQPTTHLIRLAPGMYNGPDVHLFTASAFLIDHEDIIATSGNMAVRGGYSEVEIHAWLNGPRMESVEDEKREIERWAWGYYPANARSWPFRFVWTIYQYPRGWLLRQDATSEQLRFAWYLFPEEAEQHPLFGLYRLSDPSWP